MKLTEEQKEALFKNCKSGVESAFLEDMLVIDENRLIIQRLKNQIEEFNVISDELEEKECKTCKLSVKKIYKVKAQELENIMEGRE